MTPKVETIVQIAPLKFITWREILDRVTSIPGGDLLLWRSMFFVKEIGEKRISFYKSKKIT